MLNISHYAPKFMSSDSHKSQLNSLVAVSLVDFSSARKTYFQNKVASLLERQMTY
jgi:hypothetical protein